MEDDGSGQLVRPSFEGLSWSAISLRQTESGTQPNRLYMKVELRSGGLEGSESVRLTMTLVEFRLWQ